MEKNAEAKAPKTLDEAYVAAKIAELAKTLPKFPDGRIDYTNSNYTPVASVFVLCGDEMLLLKRSDKVANHKGKWSTVTGYLDEQMPAQQKILRELLEETGIGASAIKSVRAGPVYERTDENGKTWLISPFVAELTMKPGIKLDFEHTDYKWIAQADLGKTDTTEGIKRSWMKCQGAQLRKG